MTISIDPILLSHGPCTMFFSLHRLCVCDISTTRWDILFELCSKCFLFQAQGWCKPYICQTHCICKIWYEKALLTPQSDSHASKVSWECVEKHVSTWHHHLHRGIFAHTGLPIVLCCNIACELRHLPLISARIAHWICTTKRSFATQDQKKAL